MLIRSNVKNETSGVENMESNDPQRPTRSTTPRRPTTSTTPHDARDQRHLNDHEINDASATHDINDNRRHDSVARAGFASDDTTAGTAAPGLPQAYAGPVSGLQHEYVGITGDHLNIGVSNDNWFIHSGSGDDAITVHGGTNVLDGGTGSNFLTGGTGRDTFFVDDRAASADIWSTVNISMPATMRQFGVSRRRTSISPGRTMGARAASPA